MKAFQMDCKQKSKAKNLKSPAFVVCKIWIIRIKQILHLSFFQRCVQKCCVFTGNLKDCDESFVYDIQMYEGSKDEYFDATDA